MDTESFKVLTLNCWGVFAPLFCEKRVERLAAIADKLNEGEYDIVLLQEVYMPKDFYKIRETLKFTFPYSNYYHSCLFGSGCCIFTKFKIMSTFFFPYTLNGYAHRIQHGDWYAGKGVGMAVLKSVTDFIINVYVTHTHARYQSILSDEYCIHRLNQGFELCQFINLTSSNCHAVILAGDLNMDEGMDGFHIISTGSGLKDAWLKQPIPPKNPQVEGATSHRPDNSFCSKSWLTMHADGERLDYIFYKQSSGVLLECTDCKLTMRKMHSDPSINYSDHEGIEASFNISFNEFAMADSPDYKQLVDRLRESLAELDNGIHKYTFRQFIHIISLIFLFICIAFNIPDVIVFSIFEIGLPGILNRIILMVSSITFFLIFWHTVVIHSSEIKAIKNTQKNMSWIIHSNTKHCNGDLMKYIKYC